MLHELDHVSVFPVSAYLRSASNASKKAFVERLFAQHSRALRAFFYHRVRHQPDAAELAQEVYARMLRICDTDAIRNPEAYLYTVARNLTKEHRLLERRVGDTIDVDDAGDLPADLPSVSGQIDTEQRVKRLREVLQQLTPKCRAAVVLKYWHGLTYEGIAVQLGISTHMVKKYLSHALAHCRRRMA